MWGENGLNHIHLLHIGISFLAEVIDKKTPGLE